LTARREGYRINSFTGIEHLARGPDAFFLGKIKTVVSQTMPLPLIIAKGTGKKKTTRR
tara:strand:- start:269 stop:442 length:174 start_codon:yes stop_codon:yes gene_type:complete